jgi:hypothetical protein
MKNQKHKKYSRNFPNSNLEYRLSYYWSLNYWKMSVLFKVVSQQAKNV